MKTVLYTALALAFATPSFAAVYDLGDKPLTPAQQALVASILDSDDNENTKQRRIDAAVGNFDANVTEEGVAAAKVRFILSSDASSNDKERRIKAALR